jgi:hypothetical protein
MQLTLCLINPSTCYQYAALHKQFFIQKDKIEKLVSRHRKEFEALLLKNYNESIRFVVDYNHIGRVMYLVLSKVEENNATRENQKKFGCVEIKTR